MPSRSITVSTWASESAASLSMRAITFFHASGSPPTPLPEKPLPMVVPPLTPPPLRVEGADTEIAALQYRDVDPRARQFEPGRQAAIARADDQHVRLERRILTQLVGGMPPLPPPRRGLEILVEDAVGPSYSPNAHCP
jgi:hypothetical protein